MGELTLTVPAMYADHHVLKVRSLLAALPGVSDVLASAAFRAVSVEFDPARTSADNIVGELTVAGYPPENGAGQVPAEGEWKPPERNWDILGKRATQTNAADLALSGEFRKY
jgi:copper chaperone CopZ